MPSRRQNIYEYIKDMREPDGDMMMLNLIKIKMPLKYIKLIFIIVLALYAFPCIAGNIIYYDSDGNVITKFEYEEMVNKRKKGNYSAKKAKRSKKRLDRSFLKKC